MLGPWRKFLRESKMDTLVDSHNERWTIVARVSM